MSYAISLTILAQFAAIYLAASAVIIAGGIAIGIAARFSETLHVRLCRELGYADHDIIRKG